MDLLTGGDNGLSVLVTMCGRTVDLKWLCSRGHSVTGVELSPLAVEQYFKENSIPHTVTGVYVGGGREGCICFNALLIGSLVQPRLLITSEK